MIYKLILAFLIALIAVSCSDVKERTSAMGREAMYYTFPKPEYLKVSAKIDSFFQNRYKRGLFNGNVLFAEKGSVVYKNAFGVADFKSKELLNIESRFQLASVTKPFTAYAVMLLRQNGLISYEDSIRKFIPEFPYDNISIHQLLIHRSGLPNYMYFADKYWRDSRNITIGNSDVIDLMIEYEPKRYFLPGRKYNYSNTNYAILASIIEKVSGRPYNKFMKENIFVPLGMLNTSVYNKNKDPKIEYEVKGYSRRRRKAENTYLNGVVGDKGIYSTVEDMYKFDRALYNGKLLNKAEIERAYLLGHEELYDNDNYGYGWRINMRSDSTKMVYHSGWWKGFRSYFYRDLETEKLIVVLTNKSNGGILRTRELLELFDISEKKRDN